MRRIRAASDTSNRSAGKAICAGSGAEFRAGIGVIPIGLFQGSASGGGGLREGEFSRLTMIVRCDTKVIRGCEVVSRDNGQNPSAEILEI